MIIYDSERYMIGALEINKVNHRVLDTPQPAKLRRLTEEDIPAMAELSDVVYHSLREGQECFIHKKDAAHFQRTVNEPDTHYFGVFAGGKLVAMSLMKMAENNTQLWEEFPSAQLNFFSEERAERLGIAKTAVACLGADSMHPEYRGNNLNAEMVRFRSRYAERLGATDAVSIIDRQNIWNMKPYFNNGFMMFASSVDPLDNGKIALLHKPLSETAWANKYRTSEVHYADYSHVDASFGQDKVAIGINKENGHLQMAPTNYYREFNHQRRAVNSNFVMERISAVR